MEAILGATVTLAVSLDEAVTDTFGDGYVASSGDMARLRVVGVAALPISEPDGDSTMPRTRAGPMLAVRPGPVVADRRRAGRASGRVGV